MRYTAFSSTSSTSFCGQHVQPRCFCSGLANCCLGSLQEDACLESADTEMADLAAIAVRLEGPNTLNQHFDPYDKKPFAYAALDGGFRL